jgi:hypothetical protein
MWRRAAESLARDDILSSVIPRRRRPKPELGADRGPLPLAYHLGPFYTCMYDCQASLMLMWLH